VSTRDEMTDLFFYWINERHEIYVKRFVQRRRAPWTDDQIMQKYKFTNVYRRLDRVSLHLLKWLLPHAQQPRVLKLFNIIMYRAFNEPATAEVLGFVTSFAGYQKKAQQKLEAMIAAKRRVFTGAYIITAGGRTGPKYLYVLDNLLKIWYQIGEVARDIEEDLSAEHATNILSALPGLGGFTAYEVVTDLYELGLYEFRDVDTWANPGPGAIRGLNRIHGRPLHVKGFKTARIDEMQVLFQLAKHRLGPHHKGYAFHLREIEHSLCEFDKYMRVLKGEGRPRSTFRPRQ